MPSGCGSPSRPLPTGPAAFPRRTFPAVLREVLPVFGVAAKATSLRGIGHGLLAAYLGNDPASRVLSGTVLRGEVQSVEAVVFFTDLRGFTALADTMPGRELIVLLDDYFNCMVHPVMAHGGEVLKFMGDGMLAAFAVVARQSRRGLRLCPRGGAGGAGARRRTERRATQKRASPPLRSTSPCTSAACSTAMSARTRGSTLR